MPPIISLEIPLDAMKWMQIPSAKPRESRSGSSASAQVTYMLAWSRWEWEWLVSASTYAVKISAAAARTNADSGQAAPHASASGAVWQTIELPDTM